MLIREENLGAVARAILERAGSSTDESRIVADHLVRSNLAGHDSHGVGMIPNYVRSFSRGLLAPNTPARCVKDDGAILMFDGDRGYGQRVAREAMEAALERCARTGVTLMTLRTAHHVGRIGTYGEQSLAAGFVSIHFVNVQDHPPLMAPFRGGDARFGTNPICVAVPGSERTEPVLLDMATSKIALGKARVAMNRGVPVGDGEVIDHRGLPTRDPGVMFGEADRGALLPIGKHKGYGLALACEILAGVLSGGGTIAPENTRQGAIVNNMLTVVIDPARLVDLSWMSREIDAIVAYSKGSPPLEDDKPVLIAGDPERSNSAERRAEGIPVDPRSWDDIVRAGAAVGLEPAETSRLASGDVDR